MDVTSIIAGWKQRLTALADNPGYVFLDTPQHLIDQEHQQLTTFVGYPEAEVATAEASLGVRFPAVFRQFLLEMGKSPGDLFRGSQLARITGFDQFRAAALTTLVATDPGADPAARGGSVPVPPRVRSVSRTCSRTAALTARRCCGSRESVSRVRWRAGFTAEHR